MPLVISGNIMAAFIMLSSVIGKGGHQSVWESLTLNVFS